MPEVSTSASAATTAPTQPTLGDCDARVLPPHTLGHYAVLGVLGSGGMGVVYEAYDPLLERRVAIKRLHDCRHDRRLLREAQALARLAHPNVINVFEVFHDEGRLCIVMEKVHGSTLREWIAAEAPPLATRLRALLQAGEGIAAAHAAGLVHRDIKPDNVMIASDGRVRVMDFGLAQVTESGELADTRIDIDISIASATSLQLTPEPIADGVIGTPGYVSPERYYGDALDARADVFGFCVLVFEALYGRRPFAGEDPAEIERSTLSGRIIEVHDRSIPRWLDAIVRRGLARAPGERWSNMRALLTALRRDPVPQRRGLLRAVSLGALVACASAALAFSYVWRAVACEMPARDGDSAVRASWTRCADSPATREQRTRGERSDSQ